MHTLGEDTRAALLRIARQAIEDAVLKRKPPRPDAATLPAEAMAPGASFVTLTIHGRLRGCIGALEAYQPLADDVREHAMEAALHDYRFPPLSVQELSDLEIEISRLTPPEPLEYSNPEELLQRLRPGVDGVLLRDGPRRATFLPQVWEKIPDPAEFLNHLCAKMGAAESLWRKKPLQVMTYQVEEFREK
jgi:hypothetical protein